MPEFMTKERVRFILPFALFIAILAVSTASIFIRFAQTDAPSLVIAALRLIFASLALAPVALTRYRAELRASNSPSAIAWIVIGLVARCSFRYLDFVAGIYDSCKLSSLCQHGTVVGGIALAFLFTGAAHSSSNDRDEFGIAWRDHHRLG